MNFKIDLKNIDLKNITMEDIQAKLKNVDKKTWIKIGVSVGAVVFFLVIFYGVLNPIVNKKKGQLDDMIKKKEETAKFISDIKSKNNKIEKKRPQYEQYSTLFHTKAEVEGLYQTLSEFAAMNNLIISKIEKKKITEVTKADAMASLGEKKSKKTQKKEKRDVANIAYYKIPVDFEITGNFLGYIKFKRPISITLFLYSEKQITKIKTFQQKKKIFKKTSLFLSKT